MRKFLLAGLIVAALPASAQAVVNYDAFSSYTGASSVAGNFTFGTFNAPAATFVAFTPSTNGCAEIGGTVCSGNLPGVYKTSTGAHQSGSVLVPDDALVLHGGPNAITNPGQPYPYNNLESAIVFTATIAGSYTFAYTAAQADTTPVSVTFAQLLVGLGGYSKGTSTTLTTSSPTFTGGYTVNLAIGDMFGVTLGNDGSFYNDSTAVNFSAIGPDAPVAAVPEPASWAMMVGGFGLLGFGMRASRRKVTFA